MCSLPESSQRPTAPAPSLQVRSTAGPWRSSTSSSHAAGRASPCGTAARAHGSVECHASTCAVVLARRSYDINVTPDKRKALLHREQDVLDVFQEVSAAMGTLRLRLASSWNVLGQSSLDCGAGPHKGLGSGAWIRCNACHGHTAAQTRKPGPCSSSDHGPAGAVGVYTCADSHGLLQGQHRLWSWSGG